ncbi:MAG: acyl transferase [Flavobacteriales bacterium]|nr:acyl transferase [Flavobacteriales bacterium]
MRAFDYQSKNNPVYARYMDLLGIKPAEVDSAEKIPYLPIQFFKTQEVKTGIFTPEVTFLSSGTTGMSQSCHYVRYMYVYTSSYKNGWKYHYGDIKGSLVLALLPSYLERKGSSLIEMAQGLINDSQNPQSGFFLYQHDKLFQILEKAIAKGEKIILLGVSFALLDFVEKYHINLPEDAIVMETGGMKGRRREMIREELHGILKEGFGVQHIHSEYGMTEMLSQAYSKGEGVYSAVPWLGVRLRSTSDPLSLLPKHSLHRGGINITDLANIHSCCFIATQDIGKLHQDGTFEVLGRFSSSDVRGCNLMVSQL